jgi:hypothetical protein
MKYKVVCEVSFPVFECTFDVNIPYNKTVYFVTQMLDKIIQENIYPNYTSKPTSILINQKTGKIYDKNKLVNETDIKNGTKLCYY